MGINKGIIKYIHSSNTSTYRLNVRAWIATNLTLLVPMCSITNIKYIHSSNTSSSSSSIGATTLCGFWPAIQHIYMDECIYFMLVMEHIGTNKVKKKISDYLEMLFVNSFSLMSLLPSAESSGVARILWPPSPVISVRNAATFCNIVASRHGFQKKKLFGALLFTTQSSVWQFFLISTCLAAKTKYLCINEIKLLATLRRISLNFSSHQYTEVIRVVVSFNNCNKKFYDGLVDPCVLHVLATRLLRPCWRTETALVFWCAIY